jgi:hypothetical protein
VKYLLVLLIGLVGCTDASIASLGAYGSSGHIVCYSGATVIIDTMSTGRIGTVEHSDGWEFKDSKTGKFTRVSGPCVIQN